MLYINKIFSRSKIDEPSGFLEIENNNVSEVASKAIDNVSKSYLSRARSWFYEVYNVKQTIKKVLSSIENNEPIETWVNDLISIHKKLSANGKKYSYRKAISLYKNLLNKMSINDLNAFTFELMKRKISKNEANFLNFFLDLLSFQQIQQLLSLKGKETKQAINNLESIKNMANDIATFSKKTKNSKKFKSLKEQLGKSSNSLSVQLNNLFHSFWGTFMKANDFTIDEPPPQSRWEAQYRLETFIKLFSWPIKGINWTYSHLSKLSVVWWIPYAGSGLIITSLLGLIKLFDAWFSNAPVSLTNEFKNLTKEARLNQIDPIIGRQKEINEIVECLGNLDKNSNHPLLVGQTGVGKSVIVKAFAKMIEEGKYPHLKGKQVYLINTSDLMDQGSYGAGTYKTRLERLVKDIEGKEKNVILFFDEVHMLMKTTNAIFSADLGQKFKTLLDSGKIHCIAATTREEYEETIKKDKALNRRFHLINVNPLSDEDNLLALKDLIYSEYPDVNVTKDGLKRILTLSKKEREIAPIANAKDLLIQCINKVNYFKGKDNTLLHKLQKELDRLKKEKLKFDLSTPLSKEGRKTLDKLSELKTRINELETNIKTSNQRLLFLKNLRTQRKLWQEKYLNLAHELKDVSENDPNAEKMATAFLLIGEFLLESYQKLIDMHENNLKRSGLSVKVDSALVNQVFYNSRGNRSSFFNIFS